MPSTRLPLIAGNWKMNTSVSEARRLARKLASRLRSIRNVEVLLCPPFISLAAVGDEIIKSNLKLGAQNVHHEAMGAFTGEISLTMLDGLCSYVIVGHSERRQLFRESYEAIHRKVLAIQRRGITPILCVGETLQQRYTGKTRNVLLRQVSNGLKGFPRQADVVLAYEPVWAIGTGEAASAHDAETAIKIIRGTIRRRLGGEAADRTRILYGGSVKSSNITDFISSPEIDGALVGGASLDPDEFTGIVSATSQARPV